VAVERIDGCTTWVDRKAWEVSKFAPSFSPLAQAWHEMMPTFPSATASYFFINFEARDLRPLLGCVVSSAS